MDPILADWLSLIVRWVHVMVGIMWIGTSFHFIWLDASLRPGAERKPGVAGESWMVHGGGFYAVEKFTVAPGRMPEGLHWFKYEAYFTWITGFLLLVLVYYFGASQFLVDPTVYDISAPAAIGLSLAMLAGGWILYDLICRSPLGQHTGILATLVFTLACASSYVFCHFFSGRAAYVHAGAFLGTIMAANVFLVIIPNQKKAVAALLAGAEPDPKYGRQAKQRSLHNNYLTLPVVLMMISNHYPMLYESPYRWGFVVGALVVGGLVRHYANQRNAGRPSAAVDHLLVLAIGLGLGLIALSTVRQQSEIALGGEPITRAQVAPIIQQRCVACHSATPSDAFFKAPPKGIVLDSNEQIARLAPQILRVAVASRMMPLGNRTGMTDQERAIVGAWINGAHQE